MKVKELMEILKLADDDVEVKFAYWDGGKYIFQSPNWAWIDLDSEEVFNASTEEEWMEHLDQASKAGAKRVVVLYRDEP